MTTKTIKITSICTAVLLGLNSLLVADSKPASTLPSLETLIEKAQIRERFFDDVDAELSVVFFNPGRDKPAIEWRHRWVKHGEKKFIDARQKSYTDTSDEFYRHVKLAYNGEVAKVLTVTSKHGLIFKDWQKFITEGHYEGPDLLGIKEPMMPSDSVLMMLKGTLPATPKMININRTVKITGREQVNGLSCVTVEVLTSSPNVPNWKELFRLHLARQYDYCPAQIELFFIKDGIPSLSSRMKMYNFKQIKEGLWYPTEARYDIFQGQSKPKQTAFYKITKISWPKSFDESLFDIEFPAGTVVFDKIANITYVAGGGFISSKKY